eukprot:5718063-Pyramimonas_sp.AAC.1
MERVRLQLNTAFDVSGCMRKPGTSALWRNKFITEWKRTDQKLKNSMEDDDPQRDILNAGFKHASIKLSPYILNFVGKTASERGPAGISEFVASSFLGQFTEPKDIATRAIDYIATA